MACDMPRGVPFVGVGGRVRSLRAGEQQLRRIGGVLRVSSGDVVRDGSDARAGGVCGGDVRGGGIDDVRGVRPGTVPTVATVGFVPGVSRGDAMSRARHLHPGQLSVPRGDVQSIRSRRGRLHEDAVRSRGRDAISDARRDGRNELRRVPGRVPMPLAGARARAVSRGDDADRRRVRHLRGLSRGVVVRDPERSTGTVPRGVVRHRRRGGVHVVPTRISVPGDGRGVAGAVRVRDVRGGGDAQLHDVLGGTGVSEPGWIGDPRLRPGLLRPGRAGAVHAVSARVRVSVARGPRRDGAVSEGDLLAGNASRV